MIDWHSHILPGMDDGSRNVAESISLVNMQASQGASTVIATPHFYANDETVESFLDRRGRAAEQLKAELPDSAPEILLGAEVKYYDGISRMADLKALRIENSKLLLLEMPMARWSEYAIRELVEMASKSSTRIVLAHIERYMSFQKRDAWQRLAESGILMQVNASFFTSLLTKRKALTLLCEGGIQFIGSDCHNLTTRAPHLDKALEVIGKKLGEDFLCEMDGYGRSLLGTVNNG